MYSTNAFPPKPSPHRIHDLTHLALVLLHLPVRHLRRGPARLLASFHSLHRKATRVNNCAVKSDRLKPCEGLFFISLQRMPKKVVHRYVPLSRSLARYKMCGTECAKCFEWKIGTASFYAKQSDIRMHDHCCCWWCFWCLFFIIKYRCISGWRCAVTFSQHRTQKNRERCEAKQHNGIWAIWKSGNKKNATQPFPPSGVHFIPRVSPRPSLF